MRRFWSYFFAAMFYGIVALIFYWRGFDWWWYWGPHFGFEAIRDELNS